MNLPEAFLQRMEHLGVKPESRLLVAVSGGVDSISLLHLAKSAGYAVVAAHANFRLRNEASDADQVLVEETCSKLDIPVYSKILEVDAATDNVQVSARELRYTWFYELLDREGCDYLLTAHHRNDRIETFFINLLRGSGIKGLRSIPEKSGAIIRPLLHIEKSMLTAYAKKYGLEWREDLSNESDDYLRNAIRHGLAHIFSDLSNTANDNLEKSMDFLTEADAYFEKESDRIIQAFPKKNGLMTISDSTWNSLHEARPLYKYVFEKLGFLPAQLEELARLRDSQSGRFVSGSRYKIYRDRKGFILEPLKESETREIEICSDQGIVKEPLELEWQKMDSVSELDRGSNTAYLNYRKLKFPLKVRKWRVGDRFQPLGMKGQKKISEFLTDLKLSVPQKERVYVVESTGEICWVVGHRIGEKFRVKNSDDPCFIIEYTCEGI